MTSEEGNGQVMSCRVEPRNGPANTALERTRFARRSPRRSPEVPKGEAMRILSRVACGTALALFITAAAVQADPLQAVRLTPEELTWKPTPAGAQRAMLAGDPEKVGSMPSVCGFPRASGSSRISTPTSGSSPFSRARCSWATASNSTRAI
jgi:hypothetical protein